MRTIKIQGSFAAFRHAIDNYTVLHATQDVSETIVAALGSAHIDEAIDYLKTYVAKLKQLNDTGRVVESINSALTGEHPSLAELIKAEEKKLIPELQAPLRDMKQIAFNVATTQVDVVVRDTDEFKGIMKTFGDILDAYRPRFSAAGTSLPKMQSTLDTILQKTAEIAEARRQRITALNKEYLDDESDKPYGSYQLNTRNIGESQKASYLDNAKEIETQTHKQKKQILPENKKKTMIVLGDVTTDIKEMVSKTGTLPDDISVPVNAYVYTLETTMDSGINKAACDALEGIAKHIARNMEQLYSNDPMTVTTYLTNLTRRIDEAKNPAKN